MPRYGEGEWKCTIIIYFIFKMAHVYFEVCRRIVQARQRQLQSLRVSSFSPLPILTFSLSEKLPTNKRNLLFKWFRFGEYYVLLYGLTFSFKQDSITGRSCDRIIRDITSLHVEGLHSIKKVNGQYKTTVIK
jgi:hypothetical protein